MIARSLGGPGTFGDMENKPSREIEKAVIKKITERGDLGEEKYGVTLDRKDLTPKQWAIHFQEEMLDGAQYGERVIQAEDLLEEAVAIMIDLVPHFVPGGAINTKMTNWIERHNNRF